MTELATFRKQGKVGVVALNHPPVNALAYVLRVALQTAFRAALEDSDVEAILLYCEGRTFVAGADIREFDQPSAHPDVHEIVEWVGDSPKPVTAALHGTALGGGVELALACQFRVAAADAQMGFPEVNLGILPGAGGTQRLPRLVGVRPALELIVGGAPIGATKALELGLIDEIITGDLLVGAVAFVERKLSEGRNWVKLRERSTTSVDPSTFSNFEASISAKSRGFLAPLHCIRAIRAASERPFDEGLAFERELFKELVTSPQSKAQRHAFFGEREVSRSPRLPRDVSPREVRTVAVLGSGEPGVQLARRFAERRIPVTLLELPELSEQSLSQAQGANLRVSANVADIKDADLVVVASSGTALQRALESLDAVCSAQAIVAIVSPEENVGEAAARTKHPERILGLNFDGPSLMEVVATSRTDLVACATAMGLAKALRKVAVLEKAEQGSAGQRLRRACLQEARELISQGASFDVVEQVLTEFWRLRTDEVASESAKATTTPPRGADAATIRERCLAALANEGAKLLDEQVVTRPLEVDMVAIHGHGFPLYWGGPLFRADQLGVAGVLRTVQESRERREPGAAGLLLKLAGEGRGFYS